MKIQISDLKFHIVTLGCRVNQYESEVISQMLVSKGFIKCDNIAECDLVIINTCAVTNEAARKSRQIIRHAHSLSPNAKIMIAGCYSQLSSKDLSDIKGVSFICGTADKVQIVKKSISLFTNQEINKIDVKDINIYDNYTLPTANRARVYLKVEDGCNGKCAYCIIPKARGPVRSKPIETAIEEVKELAKSGAKEIIVTGIELSEYQYGLLDLLECISRVDGIERIRMGSLTPTLLSDSFMTRLSHINKIMPHFHISLQSGCTNTLNAMRRKYNAIMAQDSIDNIKKYYPTAMISCDLIVGFPGESEQDYKDSVDFVLNNKFFHCHAFPYSIRPGTVAATMKNQVPKSEKNTRLNKLIKKQNQVRKEILQEIIDSNATLKVLVESKDDQFYIGHSENFIECKIETNFDCIGEIIEVVPYKIDNEYLICK